MLLQVLKMLIYIDRTALFIICIYFIYYHCYYYFYVCVCVVQYNMCLSCSIDLVSICANKEIYNNNNNNINEKLRNSLVKLLQ